MVLLRKIRNRIWREEIASNPGWDPKIERDVNSSSLELALILAQAEKQLDDINKTLVSLSTKSITLLTFCLALLSAQTAYFFTNFKGYASLDYKQVAIILGFGYILFVAVKVTQNIFPAPRRAMGLKPDKLLSEKNNSKIDIASDERIFLLYKRMVKSYNKSIDLNINLSTEKANRLTTCIISLLAFPIFSIVIMLLLNILL